MEAKLSLSPCLLSLLHKPRTLYWILNDILMRLSGLTFWQVFEVIELMECYIFFQPEPKILYNLKAVGGSLTAIPGISDMIDVSFFWYFDFSKFLVFIFLLYV